MKNWLPILLIIGLAIYAVYSANSPVAATTKTSIQNIFPDSFNNFFKLTLGLDKGTAAVLNTAGMNKLGQVKCSSDSQCISTYPSSINPRCNLADGACYS